MTVQSKNNLKKILYREVIYCFSKKYINILSIVISVVILSSIIFLKQALLKKVDNSFSGTVKFYENVPTSDKKLSKTEKSLKKFKKTNIEWGIEIPKIKLVARNKGRNR